MNVTATSRRATTRSPSARLRAGGVAAMLALAFVGGCAVYPAGYVGGAVGGVYVDAAPPAPLYDPITVSPGIGFIWVPGFWNWAGSRYVWTSGRWERPPHGYNHWRPGAWHRTQRGYRWTGGRWDHVLNPPPPPRPHLRPGNPRPSLPSRPDPRPDRLRPPMVSRPDLRPDRPRPPSASRPNPRPNNPRPPSSSRPDLRPDHPRPPSPSRPDLRPDNPRPHYQPYQRF